MTDTAIRVQHISKQYRIGGQKEHYLTFRDAIVSTIKAPLIRFRRLSGRAGTYKEMKWALKDISFDVKEGEVLGIIGPNGSGKSTLLKILCRVTRPTEGRTTAFGRVASLLEVGTGFHSELTGRENIFLSGAVLGMTKEEIHRKFDEIVDFSGVEEYLDTPVKRYSSGMQVRLAFSVAAHLEPEILLIDEVLAVGDAEFQRKCLGKMDAVAKTGRTVLFVSHNMSAIRRLCSRCIWLDNGRLRLEGKPHQVVDDYLAFAIGKERTSVEFPPRENCPIGIRRATITDKFGMPCSSFGLNDQPFVRLEYRAFQKLRNSMLIMNVSRDGTSIFQSHDTDLHTELLSMREAGTYLVTVALPHRLLVAGTYSLTFAAAIGNHGEVYHEAHRDVLSFEIDERDEVTAYKGYGRERGQLVIAELEWKAERNDV